MSVSDWRARAACATREPELFFPLGATGPARVHLEDAQRVCQACGVRAECLDWAISNGVDDGVWGGLSAAQRRSMKRRADRNREAAAERR
ncbi:MAG: transcription factor WhiB [Friedmanniella sp.]|nr:transcription factor WhiB [Friedmanniella sp.]